MGEVWPSKEDEKARVILGENRENVPWNSQGKKQGCARRRGKKSTTAGLWLNGLFAKLILF